MNVQTVLGGVARRLPRGRSRVARWLQSHPGGHEVEFRDLSGHRRLADLRDDIESKWFTGVQLGIPESVLRHVTSGDWVIDVGANVGIVSGQLANQTGPSGHVWACEPIPANAERIRGLVNTNRLSQIRTFDVAIGAEDGELLLRLPGPGGSGWASVTASWIDSDEIRVSARSLDSVIEQSGPPARRLSLIKIDVEGYESQVIAGSVRTLAQYHPLLYVEFNDPILRDAGSSSLALLKQLQDAGYDDIDGHRPAAAFDGQVLNLLLAHADQSNRGMT
jgi:FkbM family methyltransferase